MRFLESSFSSSIKKDKQEFYLDKFFHNNVSILVLSIFLSIEQVYYSLYIRELGSLTQKIHLYSALVMLIYAIVGTKIQIKKIKKVNLFYKIYEISFGLFGFFVSILRIFLMRNNIFSIPVIYIAVLYGYAVIFYFRPIKSFFVYLITGTITIIFLPMFQPNIIDSNYLQDIISNNIIAWIASYINYKRYEKEYITKEIIRQKNEDLKEKSNQIEKINEKLRQISTIDALTNIYNRRKLDENLEYEYNRAKRYNVKFSVILLDIDSFKLINDTYGHNIGDKILIEISEILKNNIRKSDTVGRWGGEEFLIICPETDKQVAVKIAEKLRKKIGNNKFSVDNIITSSIGVATYTNEDEIYELINKVDIALYEAKRKGKNRVVSSLFN